MLQLTATDLQEIRRHGEESYPDECCGILIGVFGGDRRIVQSVARCCNAAPDSRCTRYAIDPRELIPVQREARHRGLEIVGFYHSHPDHPPRWSPADLEQAHWIGYSHVITRIEKGAARETASFVLTGTLEENKQFVEEEVMVDVTS